ncbi:TolC family protein, partial [Myxococcota bacterium]|nr:TolC family protein [Myxococcota bacterium]MBU1536698.1 TolC family protein [Myxococcota bacterium]
MNNLTLGLLFVVIALGAPHAGAAPLPKVPKASAPKPAVATGATKPATAAALPATASPRALPAAKSPAATRSYPVSSNLSTTPPTDLSLAVAISKALKKSPSMTIATLKIEDSRQRLEAERRNILPKFTLSANVMRWDSALQFSLGTPTTTTPPADCPIGCLTFLGELFGSFDMGNLRDIYTQQYTVQVAQPITGAFAILQMIKARKIDVKVAELEQQLSAHEARYKTIAAYIQALQAMEYLKITRKSEALIRQHLKRAQLFYKADVLS